MANKMNLKETIDKCLDSNGMCVVLETHFTTPVRQKLTKILSDVKTMLLQSKKKTKDKQSLIPEYLENVENVIDLVNVMEKLPKMVKVDLALLNERNPDKDQRMKKYVLTPKKEGDLKLMDNDAELLKLKKKLGECEQHREALATQLHQSKINNEIVTKMNKAYADDKKKLEEELWDLKEQLNSNDSKSMDSSER